MTQFWTLVGLAFKQQFRIKPQADGKGKKAGTIVLYIVLALVFVPIAVAVFIACLQFGALTTQISSITAEQMKAFVGSLVIAAQGITLLFGFSGVMSNVFNCRDADKLLYLPVSSATVFLSKFFVAYLNELLSSTLVMVCTLLPFGIGAGMGAGYYLMFVLSLLLVPLLPMLVSTLIAMPLSLLSAKIGKNGTAKTILNIVLYLVVIVVYFAVVQSMNAIDGDIDENIGALVMKLADRMSVVVRYFHPDYMLATGFVATTFGAWFLGFGIALVEFAALSAVLYLLAKAFYGKLLSLTMEGGSTRKRKKTQLNVDKKGGVVRNLVLSDFKRVVRDPQMGFQAFVGMIMVPLVVVILALGFNAEADDGTIITLKDWTGSFGIYFGVGLMAYLTLLTGGTNVLGLFPISRENKSLYLLKTLPVPFEKILLAKVMLATIVMSVVDVITALVTIFLCGLNPISALFMTVGLFAYGFGNMCYTTKGDLKNPKLGWSNFQTSLKNSKTSWIAMLLGLLSAVLVGLTALGFFVWYATSGETYIEYIMWVAIDIVGALYALLAYKRLTADPDKYFNNIEA